MECSNFNLSRMLKLQLLFLCQCKNLSLQFSQRPIVEKLSLFVCLLLGRSTVSSCDQPGCYINCYMSTPSWQWLIVSILFISTPWNVNSSLYKLLGTISIHEMYVFYIYNLLSVRDPCRMGQFVFHNPNYTPGLLYNYILCLIKLLTNLLIH